MRRILALATAGIFLCARAERAKPKVAALLLRGASGESPWWPELPTLIADSGAAPPERNETAGAAGRWRVSVPAGAPRRGAYAALERAAQLFFDSGAPNPADWLLVVEGQNTAVNTAVVRELADRFSDVREEPLVLTDALSPTGASLGCAAPAPCRSLLSCARHDSRLPPQDGCRRPEPHGPCSRALLRGAECRGDHAPDLAASAAAVPCLSAGVILSRGFMKAAAGALARCAAGDADPFPCLAPDVGVTDPGMHEGGRFCAFGFAAAEEVAAAAAAARAEAGCDEACARILHETATIYGRDEPEALRAMSSSIEAAQALRNASVANLLRNLGRARGPPGRAESHPPHEKGRAGAG